MKLYEITGELATAISKYNSEDLNDESMLELEKAMGDMSLAFSDKAVQVTHFIRNMEAESDIIANEIKRLTDMKNANDKKVDWFKNYIFRSMEAIGETEIKSPLVSIKIKDNPEAVMIEDETLVPDEYKRVIPERKEPDKKLIKETLKKNIGVNGCKLTRGKRLEIK